MKERAKIIKCYKQTQTTKQQDGKRNKNKTKQRKQANFKTRKQTWKLGNRHQNKQTNQQAKQPTLTNKQTRKLEKTKKRYYQQTSQLETKFWKQ